MAAYKTTHLHVIYEHDILDYWWPTVQDAELARDLLHDLRWDMPDWSFQPTKSPDGWEPPCEHVTAFYTAFAQWVEDGMHRAGSGEPLDKNGEELIWS